MDSPEATAAASLALTASGYAGLAAERMLRERPGLVERFGEGAYSRWKEHLTRRVQELAAALQADNPEGFTREVIWTRTAFEARASDIGDLVASLRCLRDVLAEMLANGARAATCRYLDAALAALKQPGWVSTEVLQTDAPTGQVAALYLEHLLEGRRAQARATVLDAVSHGALSIVEAYAAVLLPAQQQIGRLWHENEVSIAEEHFVTTTSRAVMDQLLSRAVIAPSRNLTVLTAAVQGNAHDIAIHAVADLFEIDGWTVIHLGGDVPAEDLAGAARDFSVHLVALSATLETQRDTVKSTIEVLRGVSPAAVLVGGPAFHGPEKLWRSIGADGHAASVQEATRVGAVLVQAGSGSDE